MNKTRIKFAAQDAVLAAIADKAKQCADSVLAAEIRDIGSALASKWGVKHGDLPDTRRSAGQ